MVNSMDLGRGFLKLQEDNNSRRSSSLFRQKPLELNENGIHYVTRINCGCGKCVPFRVKVEKDDGGLRIGKLTLATNCHLIIVIFGFFFLIAGSVLTALAYKPNEPVPDDDDLHLPLQHGRASHDESDSSSRQEGKIAGPIFIIIGSGLVLVGFTLTALSCKLNREAKRQLHMSRFTWETPPIQTPDIFNNSQHHSTTSSEHYATFGNNVDTFSVRSRELSTCSSGSGNRRDSSFTFGRHNAPPPLSTIAQAVPVGVFLFGGESSPRSPTIQVTDPSGFQEIELGSPTTESAPASALTRSYSNNYSNQNSLNPPFKKQRSHSASDGTEPGGNDAKRNPTPNDATGQSKVNLSLRPSLPIIPMFASTPAPHYFSRNVTPLDARNLYVSSRSDEPFGSIASLSTSGDIACFPHSPFPSASAASVTTIVPSSGDASSSSYIKNGGSSVMQPTPQECDEDQSTSTTVSVPSATTIKEEELNSSGSPEKSTNNNSRTEFSTNPKIANNNRTTAIDSSEEKRSSGTSPPSSRYNDAISELPPININEYEEWQRGSGAGRGRPGFRPKSILKESRTEQVATHHLPKNVSMMDRENVRRE